MPADVAPRLGADDRVVAVAEARPADAGERGRAAVVEEVARRLATQARERHPGEDQREHAHGGDARHGADQAAHRASRPARPRRARRRVVERTMVFVASRSREAPEVEPPAQDRHRGRHERAEEENQGVDTATRVAVWVPKTGSTTITAARISASAGERGADQEGRAPARPAGARGRCVRRWTSAVPTPSLGIVVASSWTIRAIANMPNALGGIRRASTTSEPSISSSPMTRATLTHRSPDVEASVSSAFVRTSLTSEQRPRSPSHFRSGLQGRSEGVIPISSASRGGLRALISHPGLVLPYPKVATRLHSVGCVENVSRNSNPQRLCVGLIAVVVAMLALAAAPQASFAAPCDAPVTSPVLCENSKTGSDRRPPGRSRSAGDAALQGYATAISVNKGQTVSFKIKSPRGSNFHIDIYRLGYYGGNGARAAVEQLGGPRARRRRSRRASSSRPPGLIDCGNWSVSRTWNVPSTRCRASTSPTWCATADPDHREPHQVRRARRRRASGRLVQTSDRPGRPTTATAATASTQCTAPARRVTRWVQGRVQGLLQPRRTTPSEDDRGRRALFGGAEYPMIRFLEAQRLQRQLHRGVDMQANRPCCRTTRSSCPAATTSTGPSSSAPTSTAARDTGLNLAFFSGNEMFWKTRFEPSAAGTSTPNRTLVSYKDTHFTEQQDPVEWTGTWRDPRFPSDAGRRHPGERAHRPVVHRELGDVADHGPVRLQDLSACGATRPRARSRSRWGRSATSGTRTPTTASARPGRSACRRPPSAASRSFTDYGSTTKLGGTATHNLTMYSAPSGARVFGSGTVQWAWGLDDENEGGMTPDQQHAAGDREPARGHGRPAGVADVGHRGGERLDRQRRSRPRRSPARPRAWLTAPR